MPQEMQKGMLIDLFFSSVLLLFIFYIHSFLILPFKEGKNGIFKYSLLLLACLLVYLLLNAMLIELSPKPPHHFIPKQGMPPRPSRIWFSLLPFSITILLSFSYRLYIDKLEQDKLNKERENIHLKTELEFLSSQISPHFMFNVLNTLVLLARKKSPQLEASLISLSQLMRYMIYDSGINKINMADEIEYLKSYIQLQKLRFGDDIEVDLQLTGDFKNYTIAPMLLIPFVENAFKHGHLFITIIICEKQQRLELLVVNGMLENYIARKKDAGIGLSNVKRRLELLYPGQHLMKLDQKDNTFTALLQIKHE